MRKPEMTTRREFMRNGLALGGLSLAGVESLFAREKRGFVSRRPARAMRRFRSVAVEATLERLAPRIADRELAWMFANCLPNTLDTAITTGSWQGRADTVCITGDIDAMWLRDSCDSVLPYLRFARKDAALRHMLEGLIRRQCRCILLDPYANAFTPTLAGPPLSWAAQDRTDMRPGVAERKWEIDSLCFPVRLAHGYWRATGDRAPFDETWKAAMQSVLTTLREQQRLHAPGPYRFARPADNVLDTPGNNGLGAPARPNGLIYSGFRPSDDACTYPFLIPANFMAVRALRQLAELHAEIAHDETSARACNGLASEVEAALAVHAAVAHAKAGSIWAYEIDGMGHALFMDDANVPSLLALPWLGCCAEDSEFYRRTRNFVLSEENPYFARGTAAEGVGSPHTGHGTIWPISLCVQALTTCDEDEQRRCLRWLKQTHAGTGFMHESFHAEDASRYTRDWFTWANALFGELVLTLAERSPRVLGTRLD